MPGGSEEVDGSCEGPEEGPLVGRRNRLRWVLENVGVLGGWLEVDGACESPELGPLVGPEVGPFVGPEVDRLLMVLNARWKLTVSVKVPTKAEPAEAENLPSKCGRNIKSFSRVKLWSLNGNTSSR